MRSRAAASLDLVDCALAITGDDGLGSAVDEEIEILKHDRAEHRGLQPRLDDFVGGQRRPKSFMVNSCTQLAAWDRMAYSRNRRRRSLVERMFRFPSRAQPLQSASPWNGDSARIRLILTRGSHT
jgi:hypothetical protein